MQVLRARRVEQLSGLRSPGADPHYLGSDPFLNGRTSSDCSIARKAREKARLQLPQRHEPVRRSGSAPSCLRRAAGDLGVRVNLGKTIGPERIKRREIVNIQGCSSFDSIDALKNRQLISRQRIQLKVIGHSMGIGRFY